MEIIYIDSLFFLNLIINYLILLSSARVSNIPLKRLRLGLAAAVGGVYAIAAIIPGLGYFSAWPVKIAAAVFMLLIAFGGERQFLRVCIIFFAISAAFGGAVYGASMLGGYGDPLRGGVYIPVSLRVLLPSFALCYAAVTIVFRRSGGIGTRTVKALCIELGGRRVTVQALRDTGNHLRDPVSGKPCAIAETECIAGLFPREVMDAITYNLMTPSLALEALAGVPEYGRLFRLVPYTAIGVPLSMLIAFRPDKAYVNEHETELLVAVSPTRLCEDGQYTAII